MARTPIYQWSVYWIGKGKEHLNLYAKNEQEAREKAEAMAKKHNKTSHIVDYVIKTRDDDKRQGHG